MLTNSTITKKTLEIIIHETFLKFGTFSCSSLLDSLKLVGFFYATNAGISINIEDLKTPKIKKEILDQTEEEIFRISNEWEQGFVSDTERFQTIIDSWNLATETLKNRIVDYYQNFDPANNLYIMAFSGARGNMSQVRQLVGMRGLMADQEGKIIDLPIQTNFREGLTSVDYMTSSYGARKGIVDTALKTADAGYLTRRLIYIAQNVVIRERDCKTKKGLLFVLNTKTTTTNIEGRYVLTLHSLIKEKENEEKINEKNFQDILLTPKIFKKLQSYGSFLLTIRSPLTCLSLDSVCQKCYGWDLSKEKDISLGEAVGIVAAQSIGEPGTQLTMRTFHTGGIFTGETIKQITAPFSGKLSFPSSFDYLVVRTNHGQNVWKVQEDVLLSLFNWKEEEQKILLENGSYFYFESPGFIKKGQVLAECSKQTVLTTGRRLKPIYSPSNGQVYYENMVVRKHKLPQKEHRLVKVNENNGILWIISAKIFDLPGQSKEIIKSQLNSNQSLAFLKLVVPIPGLIFVGKKNLFLVINLTKTLENDTFSRFFYFASKQQNILSNLKKGKKEEIFSFDFTNFYRLEKNFVRKFFPIVKSYQYVDSRTILGFFYFFPFSTERIYFIKKHLERTTSRFFFLTENDIWKVHSEQQTSFSFLKNIKQKTFDVLKKEQLAKQNMFCTANSIFDRSGFFIKQKGFQLFFQEAKPIFLSQTSVLNCQQGEIVFKKQLVATLVNYIQQTEDIVQGLPKIEELIEARVPKKKAFLMPRPGVFLKTEIGLKNSEKNEYFQNTKFEGKQTKYEILKGRDFGQAYIFSGKKIKEKKLRLNLLKKICDQKEYERKKEKKTEKFQNQRILQLIIKRKPRERREENKKIASILRYPISQSDFAMVDDLENKQVFCKKIQYFYIAHSIAVKKREDLIIHSNRLFFPSAVSLPIQDSSSNLFNKKKKASFFEKRGLKDFEIRPVKKSKKKNGPKYPTIGFFKKAEKGFAKVFSFSNRKKNITVLLKKLKIGKRSKFIWRESENKFPLVFFKSKLEGRQKIKNIITTKLYKKGGNYLCLIKKGKNKKTTSFNEKKWIHFYGCNPIVRYSLGFEGVYSVQRLGNFLDIGEPLTSGLINLRVLLRIFFNYHLTRDNQSEAAYKSVQKLQLLLVNSIQAIYQSQGVTISSKHIEVIVRQMTSKGRIRKPGSSPFLPGESLSLGLLTEIYLAYENQEKEKREFVKKFIRPTYAPQVLSTTKMSLKNKSFFASAGFQESRRILSKAAIEGRSDWFRGLKENIILGRLIPAGSTFFNYKNYLDTIYYVKKTNFEI